MEDYIIVSYATKDEKFLNYADRFLKNLKNLNIQNYDITYIESFDPEKAQKVWDYQIDKMRSAKRLAALCKPTIILNKLLKNKKMIIFMDIDAILTGTPNFSKFTTPFDVGIAYRPNNNLPMCDAVHVYNYTENAIRLLKSWKSFCDISNISYFGDHRRLDILINLFKEENRFFKKDFKSVDVTDVFKNIFKETLSISNKSKGLRGAK